MKSKRIQAWVLYGILYLAIVIAGYFIYTNWIQGDQADHEGHPKEQQKAEEHLGHGNDKDDEESTTPENQPGEHNGHDNHGAGTGENEVIPSVAYDETGITISVKDINGDPVTNLEINHEKLMHLIVVSTDLESYNHFHPEQVGEGEFRMDTQLPDGSYQVFVDIKPADSGYHIEALPLTVGQHASHAHAELVPDRTFSQSIAGVTVTMDTNQLVAGEPIKLDFMIDGAEPEPYLGALGHVVILDEAAVNFIHVHPVSDTQTSFETQFDSSGLYKIWAEFQFDGEVHVYPFVIEVQEK